MRKRHPLASGTLRKSDYLTARHVAVSPLGDAVPLDVLLHHFATNVNVSTAPVLDFSLS